MRDGLAHSAVKRIALSVYDARLAIHRSHADIRYDLGGECVRCSACCEAPGIQLSWLSWYVPLIRPLVVAWHRLVNGFVLIEARRADRALIFECTHFDPVARACDSYDTRPGLCRDYPRLFLEQANPEFFEGCGYKALPKNRGRLVQILREHELAPEQIEKITTELNLED